ncbi:S4 domain-containing protein [Candidatus Vidania fulgoroideorum]
MQKKRNKLTQRLGTNLELFSNPHKNIIKRHTTTHSLFKRELLEKQKIQATYQITASTLKTIITKLKHTKTKLKTLIKLLETRLDNVLFRAGVCPTRKSAKQLIVHKKIKLNGIRITKRAKIIKKADIIKTPFIIKATNKHFIYYKNKFKIKKTNYYKKYIKQYNEFLLTRTLT